MSKRGPGRPENLTGGRNLDQESRHKAAERAIYAASLLAQGMPAMEVQRAIQEKFGTPERTAYRDVRQGRKRLGQAIDTQASIRDKLGEAIAMAQAHYVRCVKQNDNATGLQTLKWIGELYGLTGKLRGSEDRLQITINQLQGELENARSGTKRASVLNLAQYNVLRSRYGMPEITATEWEERTRRHIVMELPEGNGGSGRPIIDAVAESDEPVN